MFVDVDEKQAKKEMIGCQVATSVIVVMQRLEMHVDRQLSAGMVAQVAGATMTIMRDIWIGNNFIKPGSCMQSAFQFTTHVFLDGITAMASDSSLLLQKE